MREPVLIVGAGLAGLAAAVELARGGLRVIVADQARAPGGAIHRQPLSDAGREIATAEQRRRWASLMSDVCWQANLIDIWCGTRFAGIDHHGTALLTGTTRRLLRPSAVVLATGATERVRPRPGWTLPGVMTTGALQLHTKTLGTAPQGRVLLAGSGPLLVAAAANMVSGGNPPVAIVEAGRPFSQIGCALFLPISYLREAAGYMATLLRARVPILTEAELVGVERGENGLRAMVERDRKTRTYDVDLIGLHDGIRPNDYGAMNAPVPVVRAGDCREALGARAALADGRRTGAMLAAQLTGASMSVAGERAIARERAAQCLLARIYASKEATALSGLPGDTVICRCENRTLDDLRALGRAPTVRELRLTGRFAMGRCQGRFCAEWVRTFSGSRDGAAGIGAARLPVQPVAIADLIAADDYTDQTETGVKP